MFVKITTSGPRRYVQLVESFRDENGRPKQRTVATLGRLDQLGKELESVIDGLLRVTGRSLPEAGEAPAMTFESARALGDVWAPDFGSSPPKIAVFDLPPLINMRLPAGFLLKLV